MKNKDYWNKKEAKKSELRNSLFWFIFFVIMVIVFEYLWPPSTTFSILFIVGGIIIGLHHLYKIHTRIITYPLIRIRDEFLIYNYDQKIILWDNINKINWNQPKNRIIIYYQIPAELQSDTLKSPLEKSDYIDIKWVEDKENLIHDVQITCKEKEISFIITPNEKTLKQKDLIQKNQ